MNMFARSLCKPSTEIFFGLLYATTDELHIIYYIAHGDEATFVSIG